MDAMDAEVFECQACKAVRGLASTMFAIPAEETPDGRRLVVCRRDAITARKEGGVKRVFPLASTLAYEARQASRREASRAYWADFGRRKAAKAMQRPAVRIT